MTKLEPELQQQLSLGKVTGYASDYAPELLQAVPRLVGRNELQLTEELPFIGQDIWHAYELSWLNHKGKPVVALATFVVPFDSPNLIESKSFKLYLNSLNQTRFTDLGQVFRLLQQDLSACAGAKVDVTLHNVNELQPFQPTWIQGSCLDDLDIEVSEYLYQPEQLKLKADAAPRDEKVFSHLLKSNCLITNQPDWASVFFHYRGKAICHESLLRYLIGFRQHNEFHEQCVERIFTDIWRQCQPEFLAVYARYTRRGGLDINPLRSSEPYPVPVIRLTRQ
ncbi:NADPH-dependent 7-cyano-7-deazaguanine reductase QueF [Alkalimonas sp.]|uniref:NADPH-dependent 7-cyano-7-deazaguanine reductase QueF n=1 Tax=Alkalimonas sp. TaxID=1872453 RepID=UPI00263B2B47|nr:NADPH-dependent 7-cyano-7-deazaguanine reductase QueF [Alkalimonas sp.]MCC5824884.1 NADPH-dependent 7-cyano-7-deazaguanine reductase QueF [Alkalimonas sp.]